MKHYLNYLMEMEIISKSHINNQMELLVTLKLKIILYSIIP